jgi:putative transposase
LKDELIYKFEQYIFLGQFQDGLTGFPEAIESVFPQKRVQLCMVPMVRNSLRYVSHKHMQEVATDLRAIYSSCLPFRLTFAA